MSRLLTLIAICLVACGPHLDSNNKAEEHTQAQEHNQLELDSTSQYFNKQYTIYTLDGCEYIVVGYGNHQWGTHKGDCNNPIHKRQ